MDVTQPTLQPQPLFPAQTAVDDQAAKPALSSDFETFLKMLTVQMENQDPLNPVDSADYAVQLATFSSVEQQVLTNDLLTALSGSLTGGGLGALGQWVGMEVRGASTAQFDGSHVDLALPDTIEADRRVLVVTDAQGALVTRADVPAVGADIQWDGRLANGTEAAPGLYSFEVESYGGGELLETAPAATYNTVREARIDAGRTVLVLANGETLPTDQVTGLRQPRDDRP